MSSDPRNIVPHQDSGAESNSEHSFTASSLQEAKEVYNAAKARLLNVNEWEHYAGKPSAAFTHTDEAGSDVSRDLKKGDHFKIDIPGPGSVAGEGYDWVQIEEIIEKNDDDDDCESIAIRVRPATNPHDEKDDVAHFFSDEATSNFVVRRDGTTITAGVYGRNEKPNTEAHNLVDKARNATIGISAAAGVSKLQWKKLVKGLIDR